MTTRLFAATLACSLAVISLTLADPDAEPVGGAPFAYHLRLVQVGSTTADPGAAIGVGTDAGAPVILPSEEVWGSPEQLEDLERLLGVERAEAVTGFFIQPRDGTAFELERRLFIGESVIELSFEAVPPIDRGRAHHVAVRLSDASAPEPPLAEVTLLMATDRTVALAIPRLPGEDWMVLAVTALEPAEAAARVKRATSAVVPKGDDIEMPRLVSKVSPRYPEAARKERLTGELVLQLIIDRDGIPRAPMVLRMTPGCEELAGAAVEAVRQWRYEPARLDGEPVAVWFTVMVKFALE